jgi:hypothetical protein
MQAQIEEYGSVTQFGVRVQHIEGASAQIGDTGYIDYDKGGVVSDDAGTKYNAGWQVGNWGDTMTLTPRA